MRVGLALVMSNSNGSHSLSDMMNTVGRKENYAGEDEW